MTEKSAALVLFIQLIVSSYNLPQLIAFPLILPLTPSLQSPGSFFGTNDENEEKSSFRRVIRRMSRKSHPNDEGSVIRLMSRKSHPKDEGNVKTKDLKIEVTTVKELEDYFADSKRLFRKKKGDGDEIDYDALIRSLYVEGKTQIIGSPNHPDVVHPTLKLLHERRRKKSPLTPVDESREDGMKVALVVERDSQWSRFGGMKSHQKVFFESELKKSFKILTY